MLQLYFKLLIAGVFAFASWALLIQIPGWFNFFTIGWGIRKPPSYKHDLLGQILFIAVCITSFAIFIFTIFRIELPLTNSSKALLSLAVAQILATLPSQIKSYTGSSTAPLREKLGKWSILIGLLLLLLVFSIGPFVFGGLITLLYAISTGAVSLFWMRNRPMYSKKLNGQIKFDQDGFLGEIRSELEKQEIKLPEEIKIEPLEENLYQISDGGGRTLFVLEIADDDMLRVYRHKDGLAEALKTTESAQDSMRKNLEAMSTPAMGLLTDIVSLLSLSGGYWLSGFRDGWILFVAPASLLVLWNRILSFLLDWFKDEKDPAQSRLFNPFALAGTLVILFSLYVSIVLKQPAEPISGYLLASLPFTVVFWFLCYLGRKEARIGIAQDALPSKDPDFQVDSGTAVAGIFTQSLWVLHPIFMAAALRGTGAAGHIENLIVESWLKAMMVAVIATTVIAFTCLVIWTRNIQRPKLKIKGQEKPPTYPDYRDHLASSALPYCVLVPALVFALLNLLEQHPIQIPGLEAHQWLNITFYVILALLIFGIFIQLPYRRGAKALGNPKQNELKKRVKQISKEIQDRREVLVRSQRSTIALKNISDELTLQRLNKEIEQNKPKLNYTISWSGGLEGASALVYILQFAATAITAAIATNIEKIVNLFLQISK